MTSQDGGKRSSDLLAKSDEIFAEFGRIAKTDADYKITGIIKISASLQF